MSDHLLNVGLISNPGMFYKIPNLTRSQVLLYFTRRARFAEHPVHIDNLSFPVYVVEESSGDTIFSRRSYKNLVGTIERSVPTTGGRCCSVSPPLDCNPKLSKSSASPAFPNGIGKLPSSRVSNDDELNSPVGFKLTHTNLTAGHLSKKSSAACALASGSTSPPVLQASDAFMDDETSHIMRSENQNFAPSKSPLNKAVVSQSIPSSPTSGVK
ncbi:hypothetical protein Ancab_011178 [Ancistrocladus abbreviatus]